MNKLKRGIVRIKPVYIGICHYFPWSYPTSPPEMEELEKRTQGMIDEFSKRLEVDFVEVDRPLIIKEHEDFRKLKPQLSYDVDALLVGSFTTSVLELRFLSRYGLPIIRSSCSSSFLRALRVKKFLSESKILYIGEFPSFSTPTNPRDLFSCEERFGVRVRQIETYEFYRLFDSFEEEEVKKELSNWKKDFDEIVEPTEEQLMDATRVYLALKFLSSREDANGIVVNCNRLWVQDIKHIVPCLAYDRLIDEGVMCACEGDLCNMISALILHAVSGAQAVLMGNTRHRPDEGMIYIQHGIIPLSMAETKYRIRDYHGKKWGVTGYADIRTGPMTVINIDPSYDKICVIEGTIKDSFEPPAVGGNCRFRVNMSVNGDILKVPSVWVGSQHHSMTFGHWLAALREAGDLLDFEVRHL
jgi:L-fucose isomerase-like protein